jgi:hypothetical protein
VDIDLDRVEVWPTKLLFLPFFWSCLCGIVCCDTLVFCDNCCHLDSDALILQLCHVKNDTKVQKRVEKHKSSTKLLVKNVAFEATKKDLRQLFSPFGQVIIHPLRQNM